MELNGKRKIRRGSEKGLNHGGWKLLKSYNPSVIWRKQRDVTYFDCPSGANTLPEDKKLSH